MILGDWGVSLIASIDFLCLEPFGLIELIFLTFFVRCVMAGFLWLLLKNPRDFLLLKAKFVENLEIEC